MYLNNEHHATATGDRRVLPCAPDSSCQPGFYVRVLCEHVDGDWGVPCAQGWEGGEGGGGVGGGGGGGGGGISASRLQGIRHRFAWLIAS